MSKINVIGLAAMAVVVPSIALAHVTLQIREAPAASYYKAVLQVGHGCEGTPTQEVRVKVPDGMQSAKPMPKPGWQVEAIKSKLAEPYEREGNTITEDVTEIRWTGGNLLDEHYDEFVFRGKLPDRPAGTVLYVPVVQLCEQGEHRWIEIPAEGQNPDDLEEPAPSVRLTEKAE